MTRTEKLWLGALLIVGSLTHFIGLSFPPQVVFDEVHFGKFITAYCCTHERFFDIHPPHSKLLIAGTAYLTGYRGDFDFDHIGEPYDHVPEAALRLWPALTGIALPLIIFILLRQLGGSVYIAGIGGLAVALDNALLVQTRIIALDGTLLVATFGSLSAFLAAEHKKGWLFVAYTALSGALAGLAVGTKFTGLAIVLLIGLLIIVDVVRKFNVQILKRKLVQIVVLILSFSVVYLAGWALHFALLTKPGSGDAWRIPEWNKPIVSSFVRETIAIHRLMLDANYNLTATHPYASPWWTWPFMKKAVFYWQGAENAAIYFVGNPIVWWGSTLLLGLAFFTISSRYKTMFKGYGWVPWAGLTIALLPMIRIPRALFLYHYLTPLIFVLMIGLLWLEPVIGRRKQIYTVVGILLVLGWIVVVPLTYGIVVPPAWFRFLVAMLA